MPLAASRGVWRWYPFGVLIDCVWPIHRKALRGMDVVKGFKPELLLFAAFFAVMPFSSSSYTVFRLSFDPSDQLIGSFATTVLLAGLAMGLVVALMAFRGKGRLFLWPAAVWGGAGCLLVGYGVFFALLMMGQPSLLMVPAALITAVGGLEMCIAWGSLMACFGLRRAIFWVGMTAGGGSFVVLLMSSVGPVVALVVFALLAFAGVAVPCACTGALGSAPSLGLATFRSTGPAEPSSIGEPRLGTAGDPDAPTSSLPNLEDSPEKVDERRQEGESFFQLIRRMGTVLFVPFAGLMVFAFIAGARKFVLFDVVYMESMGVVIGAFAAVPLALAVRTRRPLLPFIYQVVLPLSALVLIVLNSFPEATPPLWLAAWVSYGFFGLIAILALASLCAMAHAGEFSAPLVYGAAVAGFCLFSLMGMGCGATPPFEAQNGGPALLVVSTLYFAFLVAMALGDGWKLQEREMGEGPATASARDDFAARCQASARAHGLSPREEEIFAYLARGHTPAFIAKTLVISESTVRTHAKNIYRKLGVSSREQLMQLVDA